VGRYPGGGARGAARFAIRGADGRSARATVRPGAAPPAAILRSSGPAGRRPSPCLARGAGTHFQVKDRHEAPSTVGSAPKWLDSLVPPDGAVYAPAAGNRRVGGPIDTIQRTFHGHAEQRAAPPRGGGARADSDRRG